MLGLSAFATCRKRYYNQSGGGVYISALEHCITMKFRTYLGLISKIFMLSRLSNFAVCSTGLYIWSISKVKNIM